MMKLNQVMASAYVTAMILSALNQVGGNTILASGVDPRIAQRAIASMMTGLHAAGVSGTIPEMSVNTPAARKVAYTTSAPNSSEPLTATDLFKLRKFAFSHPETASVMAPVAKSLELVPTEEEVSSKLLIDTRAEGKYLLYFPTMPGSSAVIFGVAKPGMIEFYLTDTNRIPQKAAALDPSGKAHSMATDNSQYQALLRVWAEVANGINIAGPNNS